MLIDVAAPVRVAVGRLGEFEFPAGLYCYTGSARRNFEARIRRHLSPAKKLHWHIDYLLAAPGVRVREVRRFAEEECQLNRRTAGESPVPGFGASDCRAGCGSHLKRLSEDRFQRTEDSSVTGRKAPAKNTVFCPLTRKRLCR
ncbi:MAG: GIY-YIG nuclease family protein [Candidatus Accumulibacter sp.]|nr:GIY-YIG nuclease family protein [Accumulibacter sp.]